MPSINSHMNDSRMILLSKNVVREEELFTSTFHTIHYQKLSAKHKGNFHLPLPKVKIFTALLQKEQILTKHAGFDML